MKREDEIIEKSFEYMREVVVSYVYSDIVDSFQNGVKWADENPKSPWISVKDRLPDDDTKLYLIYCEAYQKNPIIDKHYEIYLANFDIEHSTWVNIESYNNYLFDVLYWMPIPELKKD